MPMLRKQRTFFNESQLRALEKLFANNSSPPKFAVKALAAKMQINRIRISHWLARRRNKLRTQVDRTSSTSEL